MKMVVLFSIVPIILFIALLAKQEERLGEIVEADSFDSGSTDPFDSDNRILSALGRYSTSTWPCALSTHLGATYT